MLRALTDRRRPAGVSEATDWLIAATSTCRLLWGSPWATYSSRLRTLPVTAGATAASAPGVERGAVPSQRHAAEHRAAAEQQRTVARWLRELARR